MIRPTLETEPSPIGVPRIIGDLDRKLRVGEDGLGELPDVLARLERLPKVVVEVQVIDDLEKPP
jgi:hypothetical protein